MSFCFSLFQLYLGIVLALVVIVTGVFSYYQVRSYKTDLCFQQAVIKNGHGHLNFLTLISTMLGEIYSALGFVALQLPPIRNPFSPGQLAVVIKM